MIVTAPIPVCGRFPLIKMTISRLKRQSITPIVLGHEKEAEDIAKEFDCEFISIDNDPLGNKWNKGFQASKNYNADAVMLMGSSDWCSDEYIERCKENTKDYGMIGQVGCHFADVSDQIRLVHWKGYKDSLRYNEPIGIGRFMNRDFMDAINWNPFNPTINSGLDWSMWIKAMRTNQKIGILECDKSVQLLSISTNKWSNKHKFTDHWTGALKSERCDVAMLDKEFSELKELLFKFKL
jgi:hypothetical protein